MDFLITQNSHFRIEHSYSCSIPGYLIVLPREAAHSLAELSPQALSSLGPTLSLATRLIARSIEARKIYCAQFCEQSAEVHFHLFPRTDDLTTRFTSRFPGQRHEIHGPLLLDWARSEFRATPRDAWSATAAVIGKMRDLAGERPS